MIETVLGELLLRARPSERTFGGSVLATNPKKNSTAFMYLQPRGQQRVNNCAFGGKDMWSTRGVIVMTGSVVFGSGVIEIYSQMI